VAGPEDGLPCSRTPELPNSRTLLPVDNAPSVASDISSEVELVRSKMDKIFDIVKRRISNEWLVLHVPKGIHLLQLTDSDNCNVLKSIFCFNDGTLTIFVHNRPLPRTNATIWAGSEHLPILLEESEHEDFADLVLKIASKVAIRVCPGNFEATYVYLWPDNSKSGEVETRFSLEPTFRIFTCKLLTEKSKCANCLNFRKSLQTRHVREVKKTVVSDESRPSSSISTRPNSSLSVESMKLKLVDCAKRIGKLEKKVAYRDKRIKCLILKEGVRLGNGVQNDLTQIIDENTDTLTEFQQIFWEQQKKAASIKNKRGMRWHPLMIRLALRIRMLSNTAYEALKESGAISLPSQRTLFDYTHHMQAVEGCQKQVIFKIVNDLNKQSIPSNRRQFTLMFDEMNIKNNLVFKASSGTFVGFVKLDDLETEFLKMSEYLDSKAETGKPKLAKKVLAYMIKGLGCKLKDIVAVFSTVDLNASQIFLRTWDVIFFLEASGIQVLALVCDGAAANRKFFQMHKPISPGRLVYDTINIAAGDLRPIFFISDPPHLIKTMRNCFSNSYFHRRTRKLWNNGDISWFLIKKLFEDTKGDTLRLAHKLTANHVYLNSFSCMKVKYAAQVFSNTTAAALETSYSHTDLVIKPTVEFLRVGNRFFDMLNGRHTLQGKHNRNPDLNPYTSSDDCRFDLLQDTILKYFEDWRLAVMAREGDFSSKDRDTMMLSQQTLDGMYIAINGFTGAVRYALSHGIEFINARSFNQDDLEQYFGKQRHSGGSNDNPDLNQFLQNTVALRLQGDLASSSKRGNTETGEKGITITDEPLAKRKVKRKPKFD
jgi:DNA transposase THAP9